MTKNDLNCKQTNTVQKSRDMYEQGKIGLQYDATNVVEYYGKMIKILHGCPFEGWSKRAWPSHPFLHKGLDGYALLGQSSKGHPCKILILFL